MFSRIRSKRHFQAIRSEMRTSRFVQSGREKNNLFVVNFYHFLSLGEDKTNHAAVHGSPTQRINLSEYFGRKTFQKKPTIFFKMKEVVTESQSEGRKGFCPTKLRD